MEGEEHSSLRAHKNTAQHALSTIIMRVGLLNFFFLSLDLQGRAGMILSILSFSLIFVLSIFSIASEKDKSKNPSRLY